MSVWLFILHLLNQASLLQTFDIKCPDSSQWQFKEKGFCNRSVPHYYCLLDDNTHTLTEFCRNGSEFLRPGYKLVVSGGLTGKLCSGDLFQPFKFWTNYSSECALTKSNCGDEGQHNFNNGSSTSDRACRCDHTKGYSFVHKPDNDCFCYPAYEDCSCYFRSCGHDYVLTPDYQCVETSNWTGNYNCTKTDKETTSKTLQVESQLSSMLDHGFWCQHLDAKDTYHRLSQKEDIKIFVFCICITLMVICVSIILSVLQFPKWFNVHSLDMNHKKESNSKDKFRRLIKANYYDIITTIDYKAITAYMINKNVLSKEDVHIISGKGIRRKDKNQELLQKLWRGPQAWFEHFIQALQSHGYTALANQILETHVDSLDELDEDLSDDDDGNKNIPQYNRELNTRYIKDWLDEDNRFISTTASSNVEEIVKKRNCVLVVGGPAEGKSSLIRHIAVKLWQEEDYDIVPIVLVPLIISQFYNADRKQVFVVDDFCGRDRIYETSLDLWVLPHYTNRFADIIESVTRLDQKDVPKKNIKILIACNSNVYNEPLFNSLEFYKRYSVLLSNWPIADIERQRIRKNQLLLDHMEGSVKDLQLKGFSFPLLCKLSHGKLSDQIRTFFEKPFECIKQDIKNIKEQHNVQFFVICLLAIFNNSFNVDWLLNKNLTERERNIIKDISSHFSINLEDELHKGLIKGSLEILEKTYLFRSDQTYRIVDDKIYDIAAAICGEFLFRHFVNYASSEFLAERYKLETIQNESDERKMFICIKREKENMYFDRLISDLENGDTYSFLHNKQLQYRIYRENFMKHCRKESTRIRSILVKLKNKKENNNSSQKDKSVSPIEFQDLEDNSCYTNLKTNPTIEISRIGIPLIESVIEGYDDIVNFLIEMGSDVNVIHTFGRSALYISAVLDNKNILQLLITKKANISLCDHKGRSVLYIACKMGHDEIVDKLLETTECDVEQCDDTQSTPLHAASMMGHDHVVKVLLRKKHKIDPLDNQDRTPLFLASKCGHTEVVSTLIHTGSNLSAKSKDDLTPLFAACNNNKKAVADLLLKKGANISEVDRNGRSPLLIASNNGCDEVVKLLLDENIKADIDKCDDQGCSALYLACDGGHETTVNLLLENGCLINKCNAKGTTPLHVACVKGNVNMVNTLLSHKASVEAVDQDRQTALHLNCDKGNIHTLKLLLEHKNIINMTDKHGDSPLHVACKRGNKKIVELIMESGADIDHCNFKEKQPLHIACCEGHYEIVNVLLKRHAQINRKDVDGATPLFLACKMGQTQITRLLLESKADVRICDHDNLSPLHVACNRNHYDIVQALLDKAPDVILDKDNQGKTALDFALKLNDSSKIVELLKEKTLLSKLDNN